MRNKRTEIANRIGRETYEFLNKKTKEFAIEKGKFSIDDFIHLMIMPISLVGVHIIKNIYLNALKSGLELDIQNLTKLYIESLQVLVNERLTDAELLKCKNETLN